MLPIKLAYSKIQNAGDLLNEYLFDRVFQVPIVKSTNIWETELTGIGSFLEILFINYDWNGNNLRTIIKKPFMYKNSSECCVTWGTGFIHDYGKKLKGLARNNVQLMALRGQKSKELIEKTLNCNISPVLGDAGILTPMLLDGIVYKKYKVGIIPHYRESECCELKYVLERYPNIHIIDMRRDVLDVVREIAECEIILSSSLHGLIIADAFRIPNQRIYFTDAPMGSGFKFDDYYSAHGVECPPCKVKSFEDVPSINHIIDRYQITDDMVKAMQNDMYDCLMKYLNTRSQR
ncbi:polysaccharide pyruvyl transferase family protein [Oscillospiraceae bacterium LTW-04]|nr:polysaccharide pyruvyl transferase family protein [Oscillospiraceae bacterium MB24-C1]